ncbi:DNA-binding XRE family transcriptional regulator [Bacillus sp. 196mf]|nr:DNA-binding XRE family transcriptional regulator [Bacillus sp. 196mf]
MHKNLYIARKEQRMTQVAAANLIRISPRAYFAKEHGKSDFTLKEAQKLAVYFKTTVDELFAPENSEATALTILPYEVEYHEPEVSEKGQVNTLIAKYGNNNLSVREGDVTLSVWLNSNDYSLDKIPQLFKAFATCLEEFYAKS